MLGLPDGIRGCLFGLDGVLTKTAQVHDAAWQEMFGGYLRERSRRAGEPFVAFDPVADYENFVDGRPGRRVRVRGRGGPPRQAAELRRHGADVVVADLAELLDNS